MAATSRRSASLLAPRKEYVGLFQAEIDIGRRIEQLRRDREGCQRRPDLLGRVVGVENKVAALFDQRPRQRIVEGPLRQRHLDRPALAGLARNADGAERHRHLRARPRVLGEIDCRARVAGAVGGRRQHQGGLRRRGERARGRARPVVRTGEVRPRAGESKSIVDVVGERQRTADVGARLLGRCDRRRAGRRDRQDDDGCRRAAAQDCRLAAAVDRPSPFGQGACRPFAFCSDGLIAALDPRLDEARVAAHHQDQNPPER